ncbi:MAG: hypothetical protein L0Z50_25015 [Verrucomicrobiales bacterium]|nr:hypothetical protein [Verrucomicrobiales bacterium]
MRSSLATLLGAALLAGALAVQAQTPPADASKGPGGEQRKELREKMKSAYEACKDKPDKRACKREQMCAKAPDQAKCRAEGKQRMARHMEERQKMHEACTDKRGDELMNCLQAQRSKHKPEGRK